MSPYELGPYETAHLSGPGSGADRLAGVVSHGSMLIGLPLVVPVCVFLASPLFDNGRYVRGTALQALVFQLIITFVAGLLLGVAGAFFSAAFLAGAIPILGLIFAPIAAVLGWPVALAFGVLGAAVAVWGIWIELVATWKAFNGEGYRLPIVGGLGG